MADSKWSDDAFLDTLKAQGDERADLTVAELEARGELPTANRIFREINVNTPALPTDAPPALRRFWEAARTLPAGTDLARVARGEAAFMRHIFEIGSVLLTRSLPAGYAAPRLFTHPDPVRRPGHGQLAARAGRGPAAGGDRRRPRLPGRRRGHHGRPEDAPDACRRARHRSAPAAEFGPLHPEAGSPASKEDMLGTLMGFSYLPIDSLRQIAHDLPDQDAEDIYYLWQVFGVMMGIHPPVTGDEEPTFDYIPATLDDAAAFYRSYARRNYVSADKNPDGASWLGRT